MNKDYLVAWYVWFMVGKMDVTRDGESVWYHWGMWEAGKRLRLSNFYANWIRSYVVNNE